MIRLEAFVVPLIDPLTRFERLHIIGNLNKGSAYLRFWQKS
jgi:hypothetical protein